MIDRVHLVIPTALAPLSKIATRAAHAFFARGPIDAVDGFDYLDSPGFGLELGHHATAESSETPWGSRD